MTDYPDWTDDDKAKLAHGAYVSWRGRQVYVWMDDGDIVGDPYGGDTGEICLNLADMDPRTVRADK